ncbi:alpha-2C adrenergic receptor [Anguilla anguilla]|uniref:alpha-2C adrenergic receptor n=1 Tax=Anguilla anguilla TaxID=7936 RepID=UPI0015AB9590|nr:alpha-2C adrenergic receptor [Anguilla anguilla]
MNAVEWIESFIRAFMCLLGILGNNWLAIRSLPSRMSQIRTNDALFINLATSNLITNYFVDLPDTMADFADNWFMGRTYCGVFLFCAGLSETSSIISTLLISMYWHQKLVGSLRRGTAPVRLDSLRLVASLLAGGWGVALVFSIPHFFFVAAETGNESLADCAESFPSPVARQTYEVMYLTLANAVPIAGMVFFSIQIVITLLRHQARIVAMNSESHGKEEQAESGSRRGTDGAAARGKGPAGAPVSSLTTGDDGPQSPDAQPATLPIPVKGTVQGDAKEAPSSKPAKAAGSHGNQVRAAKSVVAVATVFLVCWVTHLLLRITSNVKRSSLVVEVASYIAASYTCIIPYIFLYGVKKLSCSCRR